MEGNNGIEVKELEIAESNGAELKQNNKIRNKGNSEEDEVNNIDQFLESFAAKHSLNIEVNEKSALGKREEEIENIDAFIDEYNYILAENYEHEVNYEQLAKPKNTLIMSYQADYTKINTHAFNIKELNEIQEPPVILNPSKPLTILEKKNSVLEKLELMGRIGMVEQFEKNDRLALAKELVILAKLIGSENVYSRLIPPLYHFNYSKEYHLTTIVLDNLPQLVRFLCEGGDNVDHKLQIITILLPIFKLITSTNKTEIINEAVIKCMKDISEELTDEAHLEKYYTFIKSLYTDPCENVREVGLRLFGCTLSTWESTCIRFLEVDYPPKFLINTLKLRKAIIQTLAMISSNIKHSDHYFDHILNKYLKFWNENQAKSGWCMRKECIEYISYISRNCLTLSNLTELLRIFNSGMRDECKWVKQEAMAQIGPFLASNPSFIKFDVQDPMFSGGFEELKDYLFDIKKFNKQDELAKCLAFNFPAIVKILGVECWSKLRVIYKYLARDTIEFRLRITMASSFHEIIQILGNNYLEEFIPILEKWLTDDIPEVRSKVMDNLPQILQIYSAHPNPKFHHIYLEISKLFNEDEESIYYQENLVKLITPLTNICNSEELFELFGEHFIKLCMSQFMHIRKLANLNIGAFVLKMYNYDVKSRNLVTEYCQKCIEGNYHYRLGFLWIAESVLSVDLPLFENYFLEKSLEFVDDKVIGNKIALAKLINIFPKYTMGLFIRKDVEKARENLISIKQREILYIFGANDNFWEYSKYPEDILDKQEEGMFNNLEFLDDLLDAQRAEEELSKFRIDEVDDR